MNIYNLVGEVEHIQVTFTKLLNKYEKCRQNGRRLHFNWITCGECQVQKNAMETDVEVTKCEASDEKPKAFLCQDCEKHQGKQHSVDR